MLNSQIWHYFTENIGSYRYFTNMEIMVKKTLRRILSENYMSLLTTLKSSCSLPTKFVAPNGRRKIRRPVLTYQGTRCLVLPTGINPFGTAVPFGDKLLRIWVVCP